MNTRCQVFLAHAHEDKPAVRKLYASLRARGFHPWFDEVNLMPGQIWKQEIQRAIHGVEVFLACLSERSVGKRGYVQNEFRLALSAFGERPPGSIYLIPVRLDDCDIPDLQIPDRGLSLRDIHWVDLWRENGFNRLSNAIEHALGAATSTHPCQDVMPLGTVFRDIEASWCPEMVALAPGHFTMGLPHDQGEVTRQHDVRIAYHIAVGRYPVTFEAYDRFVEMHGGGFYAGIWRDVDFPHDQRWGRGSLPVINVSWDDAQAYVRWLSEVTGQPYRLLSEAEWEYACRAGSTTRYSWGDEAPTPEQANFGGNVGKTTEVGSYPPSPWGLYDMHGNVWEWVEDCWNDGYEGAPRDGSAPTKGDCSRRVLRGGAWNKEPRHLRSNSRIALVTSFRYNTFGFRVVRTLVGSD